MIQHFSVALIAQLNYSARAQRNNLAHLKPTISSGHWGCNDGTVESADKIVDGLTLPTSNPYTGCPAHRLSSKPDANGDRWAAIDMLETKTIRSLYIAVPEANSDNMEFLEISVGNQTRIRQNTLCWKGSINEENISQWIECGTPRQGLMGRYISLLGGTRLVLYEVMAYEDRLVQMYSHQQNLITNPGVFTVGAALSANEKNIFQLKNRVQTDTTCLKQVNNNVGGSFFMDWKARFEVSSIVILSTPSALGSISYASPVNDLWFGLDCTDPTACSMSSHSLFGTYANPELKITSNTAINRIRVANEVSIGTFIHCVLAVLSPCSCDATSYEDIQMHADCRNPAGLLKDGRVSVTIDVSVVTTALSFTLIDVQTLGDSVSLVCSTKGDFCGLKELFLWHNSATIPFTSLPVGWSYNAVTRVLSIDPLQVTQFGLFYLRARLAEFPNASTGHFTTQTTFLITGLCKITASTIEDFTVINLATAQLQGTFKPFKVFNPICELQYTILPISINDMPTTDSIIKSIDLEKQKFLVLSDLVNQVGKHKFEIRAQWTADATTTALSNEFIVTVVPDTIASNLVVMEANQGTVAEKISYGLGSGAQNYLFEVESDTGNTWVPNLSIQGGESTEFLNEQNFVDQCDYEKKLCLLLNSVSQTLSVRTNKRVESTTFYFLIKVFDRNGMQSSNSKKQLISLELVCQLKQVEAVHTLLKFQHIMGSGVQNFAFPTFKQTPNCELPLEHVQITALSNNQPTLLVTPIGLQIEQTFLDSYINNAFLWSLFVSIGGIQSSKIQIQITFIKNEVEQSSVESNFTINDIAASHATQNYVSSLFPGVVVKEWTPENSQSKSSRVSFVSNYGPGRLVIKLSESVILPAHFRQALNTTRKLEGTALNEFGLDDSAVTIKAISNQKDKDLYLGLTYHFMNITGDELLFALDYPDSLQVSKGKVKDKLIVTIQKPYLFVGNISNQILFNQSQILEAEIPVQHPGQLHALIVSSIGTAVESMSISLLIAVIVAQFLGKSIIKKLWSFFMVLQLLVLTYYVNKESYPANASLVFDTIKGILDVSALPKDEILDFVLKGSKDEILPGDGLLQSLGVMGAALTFILTVLTILFMLRRLVGKDKISRLQKIITYLIDKICWNLVIKTFQAGFLGYAFSAMNTLVWSTTPHEIALSALILVCIVAIVAYQHHYLHSKTGSYLFQPETKTRIGALFSEVDVFRRIALMQATIFYVYRLMTAMILVGFIPFCQQLNCLIILTLMEICFIAVVKPYVVRRSLTTDQQRLEIVNQCMLYLVFVLKLAQTDLHDTQTKYYYGWVQSGLIAVMLFANILNLLPLAIQALKKYLHKRKCERILKRNKEIDSQNYQYKKLMEQLAEQSRKLREKKADEEKELSRVKQLVDDYSELEEIQEENSRFEQSEPSVRDEPEVVNQKVNKTQQMQQYQRKIKLNDVNHRYRGSVFQPQVLNEIVLPEYSDIQEIDIRQSLSLENTKLENYIDQQEKELQKMQQNIRGALDSNNKLRQMFKETHKILSEADYGDDYWERYQIEQELEKVPEPIVDKHTKYSEHELLQGKSSKTIILPQRRSFASILKQQLPQISPDEELRDGLK